MPGKVNPVIPEVVNQVAFEVIGNDVTVSFAAEAGQLQLNAFEPIIAHSLFKSIDHLASACRTLADRCVEGITANRDRLTQMVESSIGLVTALNPFLGYARASEIAREALATGKRVYDLVLERGWMTREQLDQILRPGGAHAAPVQHGASASTRSLSRSGLPTPVAGPRHRQDPGSSARTGHAGAGATTAQRIDAARVATLGTRVMVGVQPAMPQEGSGRRLMVGVQPAMPQDGR